MQLDPIKSYDENAEEQHRQMILDHQDELIQILEDATKLPDDAFPEFLFKPQINDFGDNYFNRALAAERQNIDIRTLRKKYSNYWDYLDALEIWNDYMDMLVEQYGTRKILMSGIKLGLIDEIVPDKPTLKKKKENKMILQMGFMPSRRVTKPKKEELRNLIDQKLKISDQDITISDDVLLDDTPPKNIKKAFRKSAKQQSMELRKSNIYSQYNKSDGLDAIIDFMNSKKSSYYNDKGKGTEADSITGILAEKEKYEGYTPEEIERLLCPKRFTFKHGRYVDENEEELIEFYAELYRQGFDLLGTAAKSMSRSANKMLIQKIAPHATGPMSKKQLKKMKKSQKKEEKRFQQQLMAEDKIHNLLLGNKLDFKSDALTDFRLKDIFPDELD